MVHPIIQTANIKEERKITNLILEVNSEVPGRIQVEASVHITVGIQI